MTDPNRKARLDRVRIVRDISINEAIRLMEDGRAGILLLCDQDYMLLGVLTDGDVRRAILNHVSFEEPCISIASTSPKTGLVGLTMAEATAQMAIPGNGTLNHLPIVDDDGRIIDLILRQDLISDAPSLSAVVMAGGFGTRLQPLTNNLPKPMLPVGDRPIMEHIIDQMRNAGIGKVNISTHYKGDKIREHFGDGSTFGLKIDYINEQNPLGTAGALSLISTTEEPLLVVNGDVLTQVDFGKMLEFHNEHQAEMTVGVREHETQIPFGVVEIKDVEITQITEKPVLRNFINAGVYLLSPEACDRIPSDIAYDMTDVIADLISSGRKVVSFPINEYWKDIGQLADYKQAQDDAESGNLPK
jgi:dTDP-glucose pyrophosphorylase/CBS domain-containing protein